GVWSNATGTVSGLPSGTTPRGDAKKFDLAAPAPFVLTPPFSAWPSCAYSLTLTTYRKLTTGESNDWAKTNQVIFCK
ncbi:hypothetical protein, partial [Mucilaginibacter sp.]|uniref:hypothetical protein n=1 Tax=Mucilaginibacter sp. TaxID=1882438 RepID=UPI002ED27603